MRPELRGYLALFVAASCWGGTYVTSKYVLAYVGSFALVLLRYFLASLAFIPIWLAGARGAFPRKELGLLVLTSFIGLSVSSWAQFQGTALSSAHAGALRTSSAPAFMVIFAAVILDERITSRKVLALGVATAGVLTVIGPGEIGSSQSAVFGDLLLVVAGLTWALYSILIRRLSTILPIVTVTTFVTVIGTLLAVPIGVPDLASTKSTSVAVVLNVLYIGLISTALAYYLWNKGLELVEAGTASIFFFAQPVTGTFFAWLFLGERLTWGFFLGGSLVLAGVGIASSAGINARSEAPPV
jgi:drug/metabolite transporter (DMT)-like permease